MLFVLILAGVASTASAEPLFKLTILDYFGMKERQREREQEAFTWAEPGYAPPQEVIDLLDDPNEHTARCYLQWHRGRLKRLAQAQRMIEALEASFPTGDPE